MKKIKTPRDAKVVPNLKSKPKTNRDVASNKVPTRTVRNLHHCHDLKGARDIARIDCREWESGVSDMLRNMEAQRYNFANRFHFALERIQVMLREGRLREDKLQSTSEELEANLEELRATTEEMESTNEELRATSEELRTAGEYSRRLIEASLDPLVTIGPDGKIMDANAETERVTGRENEELVGKDFSDYFSDPESARAGYQQAFREGSVRDYALELVHMDGHVTPVLYNASVFRNEVGEVVGVFAAARDVTEQKRAEEKLRKLFGELKGSQAQLIQAGKMGAVGTMTAGIAHELNNPMMGILNFIQYCLKHVSREDKTYAVLQDAERETKRSINIVQNLLKFSHMEKAGEEAFQKESCAAIFDRIFHLLSYRIETQKVSVTRHTAEGTPEVWMNPNNIQQVFLNFVNNALDALEKSEKKEIDVDIRREDEFVKVTVADSGCGIDPENLQKIFDPFFTTKPAGQGIGLGLSVSYSIIQAHGGKITCDSKPGSGTKFEVCLPIERRKEETK